MPLPWVRLAQLVPVVLGLSRELLDHKQKARAVPLKNMEARIAGLEETQRKEAELVHALAEQSAALAQAAASLRRQFTTLLVVAAVGAALSVAALLVAILR